MITCRDSFSHLLRAVSARKSLFEKWNNLLSVKTTWALTKCLKFGKSVVSVKAKEMVKWNKGNISSSSWYQQVLILVLYINFIKPFRAFVLILYPLKTPEAFWFTLTVKGFKMGNWAEMVQYEQVPNPCYVIIYNLI